jgi:hypothetical protein
MSSSCNHIKILRENNQYYCNICDAAMFHDQSSSHSIYKPKFLDNNETSKQCLIKILKELLELCEISPVPNQLNNNNEQKSKVFYVYLIFDWLSKNMWFMEKHERFRLTAQHKLSEFREVPHLTKEILNDFSWMENAHPPYKNITSRGRILKPPVHFPN